VSTYLDPHQRDALDVARDLCRAGIPFFLGTSDPTRPNGYRLPLGWQRSTPDPSVIEAWQPGMALCMVTGHGLDLIDVDPRSGGVAPDVPTLGLAETPSGGRHLFIPSLDVASLDGKYRPGVDVKAGTSDGRGRGFAFVAPTVRKAKTDGVERVYAWVEVPDVAQVRRAQGSLVHPLPPTLQAIREEVQRIHGAGTAVDGGERRRIPRSVAAREWGQALQRLIADLQAWNRDGWGGEAHTGLLEAAKHLVLLSPDHAADAYRRCFEAAGVEPDAADLAKLDSALEKYATRADDVVEDADLDPDEAFWLGAEGPVGPPFAAAGEQPDPSVPGLAERTGRALFDFYTQAELRAFDKPAAVVDGVLLAGTVTRLYGPSNVGKTWVAVDIGAHVANGMPWQGHMVKPGPVVYVYAEGATSSSDRMDTWTAQHSRDTGMLTWPEAVEVGGPTWNQFVAKCAELRPALVLLDTLKACTLQAKENDNDDMARVAAYARVLAEASGACVLFIHHNGWAAEGRARGASAMIAALDTELELAEGEADLVLLLTRKQRHIEKGKPIPLRLRAAHGGVVVEGLRAADDAADDFFEGSSTDRAAQALFEALVAHERAGWTPPASLGVRELTRVLREELNRTGRATVMRRAVHMFKAAHGQPVLLDPEDGCTDTESVSR
jgi:hypothetical protein